MLAVCMGQWSGGQVAGGMWQTAGSRTVGAENRCHCLFFSRLDMCGWMEEFLTISEFKAIGASGAKN